MVCRVVEGQGFAERFALALAQRESAAGITSVAKLLDDYETLVRDLAAFPEMGAPVDLGDGSIGLRWLPLQNLIVVHERRGSDVLLADLFFAGEDWTETLRGRPAD